MFYFCCGDIFIAMKTATKARLVFGGQLAPPDWQKALGMSSKLLHCGCTISSWPSWTLCPVSYFDFVCSHVN